MSLDQIMATVNAQLTNLTGLDAKLAFDFGDDGIIAIDATQTPPVICEDPDEDVDCTIKLSMDNFEKLAAGNLNPMFAYTMGKLKIEGSLGLAMKIASRFED